MRILNHHRPGAVAVAKWMYKEIVDMLPMVEIKGFVVDNKMIFFVCLVSFVVQG